MAAAVAIFKNPKIANISAAVRTILTKSDTVMQFNLLDRRDC